MTADNEFTLYLDGRKLGREQVAGTVYLRSGPVADARPAHFDRDCYNGSFFAGMLWVCGLI